MGEAQGVSHRRQDEAVTVMDQGRRYVDQEGCENDHPGIAGKPRRSYSWQMEAPEVVGDAWHTELSSTSERSSRWSRGLPGMPTEYLMQVGSVAAIIIHCGSPVVKTAGESPWNGACSWTAWW